MKEHGIFTSKSEYWIHLHPLDLLAPAGVVYWYLVQAMRQYIELMKLKPVLGFSKDPSKTASGGGFLVPKSAFFISKAILPPQYCSDHDWRNSTDRENGQWGEAIIRSLLDHGLILLHRQVSTSIRTPEEQYAGIDGTVAWNKKVRFEGKTETIQSGNLFVQTHESGHKPNYLADGVERVTALLPLFKGKP